MVVDASPDTAVSSRISIDSLTPLGFNSLDITWIGSKYNSDAMRCDAPFHPSNLCSRLLGRSARIPITPILPPKIGDRWVLISGCTQSGHPGKPGHSLPLSWYTRTRPSVARQNIAAFRPYPFSKLLDDHPLF